MTHEQATAHAKAHAYDGYTAHVMRIEIEHPTVKHTGEYEYADVVSQTSRAAHEAQGWEEVETYEPREAVPAYDSPYRIDGV